MTDTESDSSTDSVPAADQRETTTSDGPSLPTDTATRYLYWGAFATLLLLALLATVRFYLSASRMIDLWVSSDFAPIFQSLFNLGVVLACGVGLSLLVRRMGD